MLFERPFRRVMGDLALVAEPADLRSKQTCVHLLDDSGVAATAFFHASAQNRSFSESVVDSEAIDAVVTDVCHTIVDHYLMGRLIKPRCIRHPAAMEQR
jgi:hypothetical protein